MTKNDRLKNRKEMLMELGVSERVVVSLDRLEKLLPRKLRFKVIQDPKNSTNWLLVLKNVYNWRTMVYGGNLVGWCSWNLSYGDVDELVKNVILLFGNGNVNYLGEAGGIDSVKLSLVPFQSLDELEMKCMLKGMV